MHSDDYTNRLIPKSETADDTIKTMWPWIKLIENADEQKTNKMALIKPHRISIVNKE